MIKINNLILSTLKIKGFSEYNETVGEMNPSIFTNEIKALKSGLHRNALKALGAGCNLILHCNGNIKEMNKLAKIIPKIDNFTKKKTSDFYKFLG